MKSAQLDFGTSNSNFGWPSLSPGLRCLLTLLDVQLHKVGDALPLVVAHQRARKKVAVAAAAVPSRIGGGQEARPVGIQLLGQHVLRPTNE